MCYNIINSSILKKCCLEGVITKVKEGFLLREIAGRFMAVPYGGRTSEMHGMVALNETAAFMWRMLESECTESDLINGLLSEYEVSQEDAASCVRDFLKTLTDENILEAEGA